MESQPIKKVSAVSGIANVTIEKSVVAHNAASGGAGVICNVAGTTVRIGNVSFQDNNNTTISTGGTCVTFKNNDADIAFPGGTTPLLPQ